MSEDLSLPVGASVPTPVSDIAIEAAAAEIRHFASAAMLEFACTVGRIVLDRFYGGDIAAFRAHGRKDASLRRLAERLDGDLNLSASTLARYIAVHAVLAPLGPLSQWKNLTPKHVRAVLQLPEPEQARLLGEADRHGWSARQLEQIGKGRRATPPSTQVELDVFLRTIRTAAEDVRSDGRLFAGVRHVGALDPLAIKEAYDLVQRIREGYERVHREMSLKKHGVIAPEREVKRPRPKVRAARPHRVARP